MDVSLGSGSFGRVFAGHICLSKEHNYPDIPITNGLQLLACKQVTDAVSGTYEATLLAQMDHPHILKLYGAMNISIDGYRYCVITELCERESLEKVLRKNDRSTLPQGFYINTLLQVCSALMYLEQRGVIHRDLAARNVLVKGLDSVVVSDFGMCHVLDVKAKGGIDHSSSGGDSNDVFPVRWTAVEVVSYMWANRDKNPKVREAPWSCACDMWSFGMLMYEMFAGCRPYDNHDDVKNVIGDIISNILPTRPSRCPEKFFERIVFPLWEFKKKRLSASVLYARLQEIALERPYPDCPELTTRSSLTSGAVFKVPARAVTSSGSTPSQGIRVMPPVPVGTADLATTEAAFVSSIPSVELESGADFRTGAKPRNPSPKRPARPVSPNNNAVGVPGRTSPSSKATPNGYVDPQKMLAAFAAGPLSTPGPSVASPSSTMPLPGSILGGDSPSSVFFAQRSDTMVGSSSVEPQVARGSNYVVAIGPSFGENAHTNGHESMLRAVSTESSPATSPATTQRSVNVRRSTSASVPTGTGTGTSFVRSVTAEPMGGGNLAQPPTLRAWGSVSKALPLGPGYVSASALHPSAGPAASIAPAIDSSSAAAFPRETSSNSSAGFCHQNSSKTPCDTVAPQQLEIVSGSAHPRPQLASEARGHSVVEETIV